MCLCQSLAKVPADEKRIPLSRCVRSRCMVRPLPLKSLTDLVVQLKPQIVCVAVGPSIQYETRIKLIESVGKLRWWLHASLYGHCTLYKDNEKCNAGGKYSGLSFFTACNDWDSKDRGGGAHSSSRLKPRAMRVRLSAWRSFAFPSKYVA